MSVSITAEEILAAARGEAARQAEVSALWSDQAQVRSLQTALRRLTEIVEQETSEQCAARIIGTQGEG